MPTLKIRTQIILPFLLLMLILGVVGTYLTTNLVATSLENRIADQLVHSEDAALDAAVKLQGRQVAAIRLIANTEGVDQAVRAGDAAERRTQRDAKQVRIGDRAHRYHRPATGQHHRGSGERPHRRATALLPGPGFTGSRRHSQPDDQGPGIRIPVHELLSAAARR